MTAYLVSAQSHPTRWKYIPSDATAVVGIQWKTVRSTLLAPAILAELGPGGGVDLAQLSLDASFLEAADELLIASPSMLLVAHGIFTSPALRDHATANGFRRANGTPEFWISASGQTALAFVNGELLLAGPRAAVQQALLWKTPSSLQPSHLITRGARYAQEDLWIVASRLPDPLASLFIPLDLQATAFEGSVSAWDGLHLVAAIEVGDSEGALDLAGTLEDALESRPVMKEGTKIETRNRSVLMRMDLDERQVHASLRLPGTQPASALPFPDPVAPRQATIRILGLADGPREIPLRP